MKREQTAEPKDKSRFSRFLIPGIVVTLAFGIFLFALIASFMQSNCQREVLGYFESPSHRIKAVLFSINCGATTQFVRQVSVIPSNETLSSNEANVFAEDSDHGLASLDVEVRWLGPTQLLILHDPKSRIFMKSSVVDVPSGFLRSQRVSIQYGSLAKPKSNSYR